MNLLQILKMSSKSLTGQRTLIYTRSNMRTTRKRSSSRSNRFRETLHCKETQADAKLSATMASPLSVESASDVFHHAQLADTRCRGASHVTKISLRSIDLVDRAIESAQEALLPTSPSPRTRSASIVKVVASPAASKINQNA